MGGAYQADRAYSVLYQNPHAAAGAKPDWLSLELEGTTANRAAIGARVTVRVETPSGPRRLERVVSSGGSFGASTLRVFAGLGDATAITSVDVVWPVKRTGTAAAAPVQSFRGLTAGQHYLLKQGAAAPATLTRPPMTLSQSMAPHVHP
jgi:hypothetical protein